MDHSVRVCCVDDIAAIHRLNEEELGYAYPVELTKTKLNKLLGKESDRIFVAVDDKTVVGYVHACDYDVLYAPHMKNIMGIAVDKEFRRNGIGRALLHAVDEWAKETGAEGVRLVSGSERAGAHEFYQSCGYLFVKDQKNFKKTLA